MNEDVATGCFMALVIAFVLCVVWGIGGATERWDVARDCNKLGRVILANGVYECKPVEAVK